MRKNKIKNRLISGADPVKPGTTLHYFRIKDKTGLPFFYL
jgi:hypothetical protein